MNYYVFDGQIFKCEIMSANSSCGTVYIKYMDGKQAHWIWIYQNQLFNDFESAKNEAIKQICAKSKSIKNIIADLEAENSRLVAMSEKLVKMDSLE